MEFPMGYYKKDVPDKKQDRDVSFLLKSSYD
jgi:hypothetical protein